MSQPVLLGGAALVLLLLVLLAVRRRRTAADAPVAGDAAPSPAPEDAAADEGEWRAPSLATRVAMLARGRGAALALLRSSADELRLRADGSAVRIAHDHDTVYGDRPQWEHIAELTLAMGRAERCFPGADLAGVLRYVDKAVPVEYSPRLLADLEDDRAPDPRGTATAG